MPTTVIPIAGLESYQPAVDYKKSGRFGVLSGKNFAWDASGVYSAYASRLVDGDTVIAQNPNIVQTLDLYDIDEVAAGNKIWKLNPSSPNSPVGAWELVTTLSLIVGVNPATIPYNWTRWTTAYLGSSRYACEYGYGVYRVSPLHVWTRLTSGTIPGFPPDSDPVIAIAETNGRMCYLTATAFYWSGAADAEDLTPAIGGAGFQVLAERIGGIAMTLTPVANGVIIWMEAGALVAEFVGGATVFRFWLLRTQVVPSSAFAITRLADDDYVMLTQLGLFSIRNLNQPQMITPLFSEYMREYLRLRPTEVGHVWYSINDNRLYISFRPNNVVFSETFALDLTIDRWGLFSELHIGIFNYGGSRGQLAYANRFGIASYLLSNNDTRKNRENPANPGELIGLDSQITIGWLRATNMLAHSDMTQELIEVLVAKKPVLETSVVIQYIDEGSITSLGGYPVFDEGSIAASAGYPVLDEGYIIVRESNYTYQLEWLGDLFGDEQYDIVTPELVDSQYYNDLWVGTLPAVYHRLRFKAEEYNEYFRVNALDATVTYIGNIS